MKKIAYIFSAFVLAVPITVSAATFSFAPSAGSFDEGETFNVAVYVNPGAREQISTAKLVSAFPAGIVSVESFTQTAGWMPLVQDGYDLIDNTNGKIIKTGGFPSGLSVSKQFGTLTFRAKTAGTATVSVSGDSLMLNATNENKHSGSAGASFTIKEPYIAPVVAQAPTATEEVVEEELVAVTTEEDIEEATTTDKLVAAEEIDTFDMNQLAAAATAETGGSNNKAMWLWILGAITLLLGGALVYKLVSRF